MLVRRLTTVFQLATLPTDLTTAGVHVAGWTESIWTSLSPQAYTPLWATVQNKRAIMLPNQARIVGYRVQQYTIDGNKLLPGGSSAGRQNLPGSSNLLTDLPQVSLQVSSSANGNPNTSRQMLRGMPDTIMKGGEYQPDTAFKTAFTNYANALKGNNFGFIGRDLSQDSVRVLSIAGNTIFHKAPPATGLNRPDYIRLNRVYDDAGQPVTGTFEVVSVGLDSVIVKNLNRTVTHASGTYRRDQLVYMTYLDLQPIRAMVKKVGRPSEQYRGRRSKIRA